MKQRQELYKTSEYWLENIQNEIFRNVYEYMEKNNLNKAALAQELGYSRAYITQVLNGDFNFSIKKLIELSLAIGKAPRVRFQEIDNFIIEKEKELDHIQHGFHLSFNYGDFQATKLEEEFKEIA